MRVQLQTGDRPALRFERRLAHPPARVWRALTDPAHVNQWFPFDVEIDLEARKIRFVEKGGEGPPEEETITELDPPRLLAYRWGGNLLRWELQAEGEGCLLVFTHIFDDQAGAASFAAGWEVCLDAMARVLAGETIDPAAYAGPAWRRKMAEIHEAYVERLGLRTESVAETPEGWQVRYERQLTQPAEKVWERLSAEQAPAPGGAPPAAFVAAGVAPGPVMAVDAPALLEYEWRAAGRPAGRVRWALGPGTGHGARLIVTQSGPAELAAEQTNALAAWRQHIERFARALLS